LGKTIECLEEDLGVQRGPAFDQDAGLLLIGFVPPPVGCAGWDECLFSLRKASILVIHLDTKGAEEGFEVFLLARMDVQQVAAAGRNDELGAQQLSARIPGGLSEYYAVPLNQVIDLLTCLRHTSCLLVLFSKFSERRPQGHYREDEHR